MPYKDPANQRECLRRWKLKNKERVKELDKRWRDDNRERVNAQRMKRWRERKNKEKGDGGLRVVLTPLTGPVYETCVRRLRRRNAEKAKEVKRRWRERNKEKLRERSKGWKKANPEKVKEGKKRWREQNREKVREHNIRWKKANAEKVREQNKEWKKANAEKVWEQIRDWKKANPEKVKEQKKRWREGKKAQSLRVENERQQRLREIRKKANECQRRYRKANPESREDARERARRYYQRNKERICERKRAFRRNNKEKCVLQKKGYLKRNRERHNEASRRYYQNNRERALEAQKKRRTNKRELRNERERQYYWKKKESRQPVLPPSDCGLCLACGGWAVTWKPDWHARLKAWSTPGPDSAKEDQPLGELEDLPLDLLEWEAETLSTASTSEIDSELGDRLETLLADKSDSEVETGPATAPTRRSARIAATPAVSYLEWEEENPMLEILRRKEKLHSEAADRIVTRWDRGTDSVNAIVEEMSVPVDPHHELDRFQAQLERQDVVMDVVVNEELLDFIGGQL